MVSAEQARSLISRSGETRPQPPSDWAGDVPLPAAVAAFYRDVGPVDVSVESYGNPFFLPGLGRLWAFQAGYRWDGRTGERVAGWDDDWLVIADQGGDPFVLSVATGAVLHDRHGRGAWGPGELFADLNAMAACLGRIGATVAAAGDDLSDDDGLLRPRWRDDAAAGLRELLGSASEAERVLETLGWG